MAKFVAYGDSGLPYRSRSEHHYSDKATRGENVKEQYSSGADYEKSQAQRAGLPFHMTVLGAVVPENWFMYSFLARGGQSNLSNSDNFFLKNAFGQQPVD